MDLLVNHCEARLRFFRGTSAGDYRGSLPIIMNLQSGRRHLGRMGFARESNLNAQTLVLNNIGKTFYSRPTCGPLSMTYSSRYLAAREWGSSIGSIP